MSTEDSHVLVVDDEADVRKILADVLGDAGFAVDTADSAEKGLERLRGGDVALAFVDINLPGANGFELLDGARTDGVDTDIVIITGKATVANAVEATRRGAYDYVTKPFDLDAIVSLAQRIVERRQLGRNVEQTRGGAEREPSGIVGQSAAMQEIYKTIGRVAVGTTTVLLQGESGVGKEVIARALHEFSDRAGGPFVAVNCSAIPADLLESEMFGHERGAFTGATDRRLGKFEQAAGGTLFLDEISDMPLGLQAKLLRVLQEREFTRVGGRELLPTDCRIVAATNRDLEADVEAKRFRGDLYFRLKVVLMSIPPLRERREDIGPLVEFFIDRINDGNRLAVKGVSPDAMARLAAHSWPGNVRELENVLVRAAALAPDRVLTPEDLPLAPSAATMAAPTGDLEIDVVIGAAVQSYLAKLGDSEPRDLYAKLLATIEKPLFEAVLEQTHGNQVKAAEILGINRNTLHKKIVDHGIAVTRNRTSS